MHAAALVALLSASAALAGPIQTAPYTVPSFDCAAAHSKCVAQGTSPNCQSILEACQGCQSREEALNHTAVPGLDGTEDIQSCYWKALNNNGATIALGDYGCDAFFTTCKDQKLENNAFCASQVAACRTCAEEESECRPKPGANQAQCSADAASCVSEKVLGGK